MVVKTEILPGVTLRCYPDDRFKQARLSVQFVRKMCREEAAMNALLPALLLQGTNKYPNARAVTIRLDELYGASVGTVARRVGDYQTTGLYMAFLDDRFSMDGEQILAPMVEMTRELLFSPATENGVFVEEYLENEKRNLIAAIEAQRNDKRLYAATRLTQQMCRADSLGVPRLGTVADVQAITAESLYAHYKKVLRESPLEVFYVGSADPEEVAGLLKAMLCDLPRDYVALPPQGDFQDAGGGEWEETLDVAQGKLCMGFVTPVTLRTPQFAAMQVVNTLFGGGMTSKLFMQVREKLSLCYDIGSSYHGSKGIVSVSAGIDCQKVNTVREEILHQLQSLCQGDFTQEELHAAKRAICTSLQTTHDSTGSIESYYSTTALSGLGMDPETYIRAVEQVSREDVKALAKTVKLHTVYFLKGVQK